MPLGMLSLPLSQVLPSGLKLEGADHWCPFHTLSVSECAQLVHRVSSLNCAMSRIRLPDGFADYEKHRMGLSNLVKVSFGLS